GSNAVVRRTRNAQTAPHPSTRRQCGPAMIRRHSGMKREQSPPRGLQTLGTLKRAAIASAIAIALAPAAHAVTNVTWEDILRDQESTGDVLTYGMGLKAQRYSPLKHIDTRNVSGLVPAWSFSFGGEKQRGQEAQAIVHDGVLYVTASYSRVFAI